MGASNVGALRARFTLWYNRVFFFNTQQVTLAGLVQKKYNSVLRQALARYSRGVELTKEEQCREDLATELASLHFKQAVFSALRNITYR
jgi:hypothetical protein